MKRMVLQCFLVILLLVIISNFVYAAPVIRADDEWSTNEGTTTDGKLWINDNIDVYTDGISASADMICYDWDNDGNFDNCYWDNDGCSGGPCNADTCDAYSIPGNMNDGWKAECNVETQCQEGVDVSERICDDGVDGNCHELDTSTRQEHIIAAKIYHDCDDSSGNNHSETVSPTFRWTVVDTHKYDCDDCVGCYSNTEKDYEGEYAANTWRDIESNIACPTNYKCSEYFDDEESTTKTHTGFTDPCKLDDGSNSTFACNQNSDCASNNCGGAETHFKYICESEGSLEYGEYQEEISDTCGGSGYTEVEYFLNVGDIACEVEVGAGYICDGDHDNVEAVWPSSPPTPCRKDLGESCSVTTDCWNDDGGNWCNSISECTDGANGRDCGTGSDCNSGYCCSSTCSATSCGGGNETDLAILDVIPIQVIPDVDMVKGKSGYVRVIVHNYGPLNVVGQVNVTFDGNPLTPYNPANASNFILNGTNGTFDFNFKPSQTGTQTFSVELSVK